MSNPFIKVSEKASSLIKAKTNHTLLTTMLKHIEDLAYTYPKRFHI